MTQFGPDKKLEVRNTDLSFSNKGDELTFEVVSNNVSWEVTTNKTWLTVTENPTGDRGAVVKLKAAANTGGERTAEVTVKDVNDATRFKKFTITQFGPDKKLEVRNNNLSFSFGGDDLSFEVVSNNVSWKVFTDQSWLTVIENPTGDNGAQVKLRAAANSGNHRTANVTVQDVNDASRKVVFEVSQLGPEKILLARNNDLSFSYGGDELSFEVVSNNVSWKVSTDQPWLTVIENATGEKGAQVKLRAAANSGNSRTAKVTVQDVNETSRKVVFEVSQLGPEKILLARNNDLSFSYGGDELSFEVVSNNVSWKVSTDQPWLTVIENATGEKGAQVKLRAVANSGNSRTAKVTVQDVNETSRKVVFEVSQLGPEKILLARNNDLSFSYGGDELSFEVVSNNVSWKVSTDQPWLTVIENVTGEKGAQVKLRAAANTGDQRTAKVTVEDVNDASRKVEFEITQLGADIVLDVKNNNISFGQGGGVQIFEVISNNVNWKVTTSEKWLSVITNSTGNKGAQVTLLAASNPNETSRSATVSVKDVDGRANSVEFVVTQFGKEIAFYIQASDKIINPNDEPEDFVTEFTVNGGVWPFQVVSNNITWSVETDKEWLSVTSNATGSQSAIVELTATTNNDGIEREAKVTVTGLTHEQEVKTRIISFKVYQQSNANLTLQGKDDSGETVDLDLKVLKEQLQNIADEYMFSVNPGNPPTWRVEIEQDSTWLSVYEQDVPTTPITKDATITGPKTLYLRAKNNNSISSRKAIVRVTQIGGAEIEREFGIWQKGAAHLSLSDNDRILSFPVREYNDRQIEVKCNTPWKVVIPNKDEWVSTEPKEGEKTKPIKFHVDENWDAKERESIVEIHWPGPLDDPNTEVWEDERIDSIYIKQARRPVVPQVQLSDDSKFKNAVKSSRNTDSFKNNIIPLDAVAGNTCTLEAEILAPESDSLFVESKWNYDWRINGGNESISTERQMTLNMPNDRIKDRQPVDVRLCITYDEGGTGLSDTLDIILYPAPKDVDKFKPKGESNKSGIYIATIYNMNDTVLENFGYSFVYGKNNSSLKTWSNRYYQYNGATTTDTLWVYTQWEVPESRGSSKTVQVQSLNRRYYCNGEIGLKPLTRSNTDTKAIDTNGIDEIDAGSIMLRRGQLMAKLESPTPALVTVVSMSGTVVKQMALPARREFDEQIDLSGLAGGLYVVRCTIGNQRVEEKVVVK